MLHWHSPREDLIGVIALIVYVITCGSLSGGRNGSIFDSHTIYFLSFGAFNLQESPLRIRGKSTALVFAAPTAKDHPRACGEKYLMVTVLPPLVGSPPRMRGKVRTADFGRHKAGITPAHAGKSDLKGKILTMIQDHPRACGEKYLVDFLQVLGVGSPPRMRGKERVSVQIVENIGITPAHAGKRAVFVGLCSFQQDHPRACGEKPPATPPLRLLRGSPPRMRGEDGALQLAAAFGRITPAHAGRSPCQTKICHCPQDHPRACGEKRFGEIVLRPPVGITPAHAGRSSLLL